MVFDDGIAVLVLRVEISKKMARFFSAVVSPFIFAFVENSGDLQETGDKISQLIFSSYSLLQQSPFLSSHVYTLLPCLRL